MLFENFLKSSQSNGNQLSFYFISVESVQHQGVRGYHTFAHIKDADKVFEKINIINKELTNRMVRL